LDGPVPDKRQNGANAALGQQLRVSGLHSFSVKVAAYDSRELQFSGHLRRFPGQKRFSVKFKTADKSASESNRRSDQGIERRPPGHCRFTVRNFAV
jgi:hypothetical protein